MLSIHKGHTDTIQVYSVTVMTHVKALQAENSIQGTSEPITPVRLLDSLLCDLETRHIQGNHTLIGLIRFDAHFLFQLS